MLGEIRQHRLEDPRVHGRRGVEIEIDGEGQRHGFKVPGFKVPGFRVPEFRVLN
jgi:hypothetical protein